MTDFTGFYFDGIHSSAYGLIRTSNGDRYSSKIMTPFTNQELELVGGNGSLYGGSKFTKNNFTIPVVFDHMTEEQFQGLKKWLGQTELKELRFDECPYKTYWAKLENAPELNYICFLEDTHSTLGEQRIYKGEGELSFVAYNPFGYCLCHKYHEIGLSEEKNVQFLHATQTGVNLQNIDNYNVLQFPEDNASEWGVASGLKSTWGLTTYNRFQLISAPKPPEQQSTEANSGTTQYYRATLYNPGDTNAHFRLAFAVGKFDKNNFDGEGYVNENDFVHRPNTIFTYGQLGKKIADEELEVSIKINSQKIMSIKYNANNRDNIFIDSDKHELIEKSWVDNGDEWVIINDNHSIPPITPVISADPPITRRMHYDYFNEPVNWEGIPKGLSEMVIKVIGTNLWVYPFITYDYIYY